ncbi:hypothetical protein H5410_005695 [Solanum commersonii]|uniref:Uncharacterized protein n=1 Tax=Solanum commersonii TaxID=4109 RepID=A0A9J6A7A8_SOLCO|nr:hypothetical protein H5410_005695 [Solanum commersonii]
MAGSSGASVAVTPGTNAQDQRIWIEEQSKDTNRQKGTKQAEEMKMHEPEDCQEHSACHRVAHQTA